ncbi:MAG TPA: 1-acyl-sn-glycerol-3-phosphate acyltransferase [Sphaerochaeta sp.]|nr:1-acyl-sn-glycerol-3-phosphate acyltransferase [Sphaerochaeta sp.]HOR79670.1 1-acyl-sn-glycerol-3-phosphate acyltransferase [Sphaerochaeta sp.]HPK63930.1 1-acyl-sn-glycerol-3-phosphate acyltransferase [Sphaerochaeta sp.]
MDINSYRDIAPYRGQDVLDAVERVKAHEKAIAQFIAMLDPPRTNDERLALQESVKHIVSLLDHVTTYEEFQRTITAGFFLPKIVEKSVTAFTHSGAEKLANDQAYLYVSNHRDIILDCALIDLALAQADQMLMEMAIGDNLLTNQFVTDLFKLNGGIVVKRTLPLREKYLESLRLSAYFVESISERNQSIWVAQKSGRSKDGIDETNPAIIKMLHLSQKRKGVSFSEVIKLSRIVPVAVSYEYDPLDVNKAAEQLRKQSDKRPYEDVISMNKGLKGFKGRIHIAFGTPLTEAEYHTPEEVANEIDRQIHLNYKLWPTNYFAYDHVNNTTTFAEQYRDFNHETFLRRFAFRREEVRDFALNAYANPVRSFLSQQARLS